MRPNGITDFWSRVDQTGDCWLWQGSVVSRGYGQFWLNGQTWQTHRLAYVLTYGNIPDGLFICHRCDNPPCVRPDHLFLGTINDNAADMVSKGRSAYGIRNGRARLTIEQVREIRALYATGQVRQIDLAARFGVKQPAISSIIRGAHWRHVG